MEGEIKIGTIKSMSAQRQAVYLQDSLSTLGIHTTVHRVETDGENLEAPQNDMNRTYHQMESALLTGKIDIGLLPLSYRPVSTNAEVVVAALSARPISGDWLLVRKERMTKGKVLSLPEGAHVGISFPHQGIQLLSYRPDLSIMPAADATDTLIEKLSQGHLDALIVAGDEVEPLLLSTWNDFHVIHLDPEEFIPAPAQGVWGYFVRPSDTGLRRQLVSLHQPSVADCTNVERNVVKLMNHNENQPLGVYCKKDNATNFHVWAIWQPNTSTPPTSVRLSSSTSFELAERVAAALQHP
ncbi:MAG: hypothetical protein R2795_01950 [Saprospiraceae bacterium]